MGRPEIGGKVLLRLGPGLVDRVDAYAARHGVSRGQAARRLVAEGLRHPVTYGVYHTSGDPYEGTPEAGAESRRYTPEQAAAIARRYPWAAVDDDGDVVVGMHRSRASWGGGAPVPGGELAERLLRRA